MSKRKRILAVILAAVLCFTMSFSIAGAKTLNEVNGQISDKKQELKDGKEKAKELKSEISELETRINTMQDNIDQLQSEINVTEAKISVATEELNELKADINKQNEGLNKRLRTMYESQSVTFLEVVLTSGSIPELLTNVELLKKVHESDKNVLASLKKQHKKVKEKKEKLTAMEAELEGKQEKLESQQSDLEDQKSSLNEKRGKVVASNKKLQNEIEELNEEAERLTQVIKDYGNDGSTYSSGQMCWPVSGTVSCEYGYRYCPYHGYELHTGIDIAVPTGTSVKAAASGTVVQAYYNASYGNMILLNNGGGIYTLYAHNSSLLVGVGTKVSKGQVIAKSGNTGNSTGPHCHFEVRKNGQPVNPRGYL